MATRKMLYLSVNFDHGAMNPDVASGYEPKLAFNFTESPLKPNIDLPVKTDHLKYSNQVPSVKGAILKPCIHICHVAHET